MTSTCGVVVAYVFVPDEAGREGGRKKEEGYIIAVETRFREYIKLESQSGEDIRALRE